MKTRTLATVFAAMLVLVASAATQSKKCTPIGGVTFSPISPCGIPVAPLDMRLAT